MNRRSVLGMLGLGAAAAPTMASSMTGWQAGIPLGGVQGSSEAMAIGMVPKVQQYSEQDYVKEEIGNLTRNISKMVTDKDKWIEDSARRNLFILRSNPRIDVDILAMKSYSDIAKIMLQARRDAERNYDLEVNDMSAHKTRLLSRLSDLTKLF